MRVTQLAGTVTTTATGIVTLTMLREGRIKAVQWAAAVDMAADNASVQVEVSRSNVSEIGTNDPPGNAFSQISALNNLVTSGMVQGGINLYHPVDIPYKTGDKIYLNASVSGTVGCTTTCKLWLDE